jgi:hypothetical protein
MAIHMRRRDFITVVGGALAAWPLAAHAHQPVRLLIGFLSPISAVAASRNVARVGATFNPDDPQRPMTLSGSRIGLTNG